MFYNVGAIVGAIIFGQLSEAWPPLQHDRGLALSLLVIPFWAFGMYAR